MRGFLILLLFMVCTGISYASSIGEVIQVTGDGNIYMKKQQDDQGRILKKGMKVILGHYIQTGKSTEAAIELDYGVNTRIKIRPNSLIRIVSRIRKKKRNGVLLVFGRLWSLFKGRKENGGYAVETYNSVAGVEGTEFEVLYDKKTLKSVLKVFDGTVKFTGKTSSIIGIPQVKNVSGGQIGVCDRDKKVTFFKKGKDRSYDKFDQLIASVQNRFPDTVETVDDYGVALLDPASGNELERDGNIRIMMKFVKKEGFSDKSYLPLDTVAQIWINGCNYHKGKLLLYKPGKHLRIDGLNKNGFYEVTVLCGGFQHSFDMDMSEVIGNGNVHQVKFAVKQFGFKDKTENNILSRSQVKQNLRFVMNSQKMKLFRRNPSLMEDPSFLCIGHDSHKVCFYFPVSVEKFDIEVLSDSYRPLSIPVDINAPEKEQRDFSDIMGWWFFFLEKIEKDR